MKKIEYMWISPPSLAWEDYEPHELMTKASMDFGWEFTNYTEVVDVETGRRRYLMKRSPGGPIFSIPKQRSHRPWLRTSEQEASS